MDPRRTRRAAAAGLALAALGGCADRLDHFGRPPTVTAPGAAVEAMPPISAARAELARTPPPPPPEPYAVASLWRSGPTSLFGDRRARTVGDILTVVVEMDEEGSFENTTDRTRSGTEAAAIQALLGLPSIADQILPADASLDPAVETESSSRSKGQGTTERNESLTIRIAATVTDVLPNGHFVIYGSQEVRLNFDLRDIQVAGVIRPEDISRRNEITYDKIADARIAYGGRGQIMDLQQPRLGQQALDMIMPF